MRVSTLRTSPHYSRDVFVKLDGRALNFCIEADDVEGWVEVVDLENPRVIYGEKINRFATKVLHGFVEIEEAP